MSPQDFLRPDPRWKIYGFISQENFLETCCLPAKFHSNVPDVIRQTYLTVQRLVAYSYYYYPMEEEVVSKLSRLFEIAVRCQAKTVGIMIEIINKDGKIIPKSLSNLISELKSKTDPDPEWACEWTDYKELRNAHAHPSGPNYGGALNLLLIAPMINVINSIFITKEWFACTKAKNKSLQERADCYSKGVFELNRPGQRRVIVSSALPVVVSHDEERSHWILEPVGSIFPQSMEEYHDLDPLFLRLKDLIIHPDHISAIDYINNQKIIISPINDHGDIDATLNYLCQINSADEQVRNLYIQHVSNQLYYERARFIYEEYWE